MAENDLDRNLCSIVDSDPEAVSFVQSRALAPDTVEENLAQPMQGYGDRTGFTPQGFGNRLEGEFLLVVIIRY